MSDTNKKLISVVIPAFNEGENINVCYQRLKAVFSAIESYQYEFIYINDGSTDDTQQIINQLCLQDAAITSIVLSRNFGKEVAMTAGLDYSKGHAVFVIDADLQDPPELLPQFITELENGYDVVYGKQISRDGETRLKKITAKLFYRVIGAMSNINIPADTGDFRLMSRRSVNALLELREHHRFMKGLFAWVGFPSIAIEYNREPRFSGDTKFNYWKLWNFAIEGISSFSVAPLKIATYLGLFISIFSFIFGAWVIIKTLFFGEVVPGYPTLMTTILFVGGAQLFFIGILGEYIGRIFGETKKRPLYIIQEISKSKYLK